MLTVLLATGSIALLLSASRLYSAFRAGGFAGWPFALLTALMALCSLGLAAFTGRTASRLTRQYTRGDLDPYERAATTAALGRSRRAGVDAQHLAYAFFAAAALLAIGGSVVAYLAYQASVAAGKTALPCPILAVLAIGPLGWGVRLLRSARKDLTAITGALPLSAGSLPVLDSAIESVRIVLGASVPARPFVIEVVSVNAVVSWAQSPPAIMLTRGMLSRLTETELTAVIASLLTRRPNEATGDWGAFLQANQPLDSSTFRNMVDALASFDNATVMVTRDPSALCSALDKTSRAPDTRIPGLGPLHTLWMWTPPQSPEWPVTVVDLFDPVAMGRTEPARIALLQPIAGPMGAPGSPVGLPVDGKCI